MSHATEPRVRQLVQSIRSGELRLVEVPVPEIGSTEVLVRTEASMISAGTERTVRKLASASLLQKARARPDLVRKVITKARTDGVSNALSAVRTRLEDEMPLGYSAAGTVVAVGDAVSSIRPGMRVATGGVGHGEMQVVPGLLCAPIPDGVSSGEASFATIAAIALHGIHQAAVEPGGDIVIVGLGLIGQVGLRLAEALGYRAVGIDVSSWAVERARAAGSVAHVENGSETTELVRRWAAVEGADAVVVMASTASSDPVRRSPDLLRDRGTIVVVGDVGLELERTPLYEKEITLRLARSYGPGRYERSYEDWAVDFPPGYVRWTEGRNLAKVLDLLASGRLELASLITHEFTFDQVADAYELLQNSPEPLLGVRLDYGDTPTPTATAGTPPAERGSGVAFVGAGNFARGVLLPALRSAGFEDFVSASSATGTSADRLARSGGFRKGVASVDEILADGDVGIVVVATPHDQHAELAARALRAGCHVFCEKPLALTHEQLADLQAAWAESNRVLFVGFNRRYSPAVVELRRRLADAGPLTINYRINAGPVDPSHWYGDRRQGGRLLGEVCHFVDTCAALAGQSPHSVAAELSTGNEAALASDIGVVLSFPNGSLATITYASGGSAETPKERLEILGGGHTAVIDDYRKALLDGQTVWNGRQDKGHSAAAAGFRSQVTDPSYEPASLPWIPEVSRAVLEALDSGLR